MDQQRFDRLQQLFLDACVLEESQRAAWIEKQCDDDTELLQELRGMLKQHERRVSPLDGPGVVASELREALADAEETLLPGIQGYELLREVDRGGQSIVYEATQTSTGQKVALKVLLNQEFSSEEERRRQEREVQVLAKISHPNIVGVIDRGLTASGVDYVVMPFVDGRPLDGHLKESDGNIDVEGVLKLFVKIARAVGIAHRAGIVHRDLKPANIFVDEHGEPRILDFGLAWVMPQHTASQDATMSHLTLQGRFLGSLPWASPEQALGDPHTTRPSTDVYALGVILYQMITGGRFPYEVIGNFRDVLDNILNARPKPPSSVNDAPPNAPKPCTSAKPHGVRRVLDSVVLMSLAKNQADRYQDADAFADDVVRFLLGQPTKARPASAVSTWEQVAAWARRKPGEARLAVACLLLILATAVGGAVAAALYQNQASLAAASEAEARRTAADSLMVEAQSACESGLLTTGLHKLSQALTYVHGAGDEALEESVRLNLEAWGRQLPRMLGVLPHSGAEATSAAISPKGDMIATAASDGSVKLWLSEDFQLVTDLPNRINGVLTLAWSPDGLYLAVQGKDGYVDLIDIQTHSTVNRIRYNEQEIDYSYASMFAGMQYHPDGKSLYVVGNGKLARYSVDSDSVLPIEDYNTERTCVDFALTRNTEMLVHAGHNWTLSVIPQSESSKKERQITTLEGITCMNLFPDGRHAVTGHNIGENLQIWNLATEQAVGNPLSFDGKPRDCAVSPDGTRVACVGESPHLFVYDVGLLKTGSGRRYSSKQIYLGEQSDFVVFGPDGKWVLVGAGEHVSVWQVEGGGPIWRSRKLPAIVQCLDIHPERSEVAVGLFGRGVNPQAARYLHRFDLDSGNELQPRIDASYLRADFVDDLQYNPSSATIYAVRNDRLAAWDLDSGGLVSHINTDGENFSELDVSCDGKYLLASQRYDYGGKAFIWDTSTDNWTIPAEVLAGPIFTIATHPGEPFFCAVAKDAALIRGYTDAIEHHFVDLRKVDVASVGYTPNGRSLLFGCQNRSISLRSADPENEKDVAVATTRDNHFITANYNGDLVITSDFSHETEVWHIPTAKKIGPSINGGKPISCPDNRSVIVARDGVVLERWPIPTPTALEPIEVKLWVEKATGTSMTSRGVVQPITADRWLENSSDVFSIGGDLVASWTRPKRAPSADRERVSGAKARVELPKSVTAAFGPSGSPEVVFDPTPLLDDISNSRVTAQLLEQLAQTKQIEDSRQFQLINDLAERVFQSSSLGSREYKRLLHLRGILIEFALKNDRDSVWWCYESESRVFEAQGDIEKALASQRSALRYLPARKSKQLESSYRLVMLAKLMEDERSLSKAITRVERFHVDLHEDSPQQAVAALTGIAMRLSSEGFRKVSRQVAEKAIYYSTARLGEDSPLTVRLQNYLLDDAIAAAGNIQKATSSVRESILPSVSQLRGHVGEQQVVTFRVLATGGIRNLFLNSERNYEDRDCFAVQVGIDQLSGFASYGIRDPWKELLGASVRCTGVVLENEGRLSMQLDDVAEKLVVIDGGPTRADETD